MKLGGSVQSVTSIKQCQASLQGLSVEEVEMCLQVEASASAKTATAKAEAKHCNKDIDKMESKSSFSGLFNDRYFLLDVENISNGCGKVSPYMYDLIIANITV